MAVARPAILRPARTRFAPSPTGALHLGHAYSALTAWRAAGCSAQNFCLRIDDLDHTRCRTAYTAQITEDLGWLGLSWAAPPLVQSDRLNRYARALDSLRAEQIVYPCFLTRREITDILTAPQDGDEIAPPPSTKGLLSAAEQDRRAAAGQIPAWRLDSRAAFARTGPLFWTDHEGRTEEALAEQTGDVILGRRDIAASYHLSVVLDDADSDIALVVRGADLAATTPIHRLLQALLGLAVPTYLHHPLVRDESGKRLAKRDQDRSLKAYRQAGLGPEAVIALLPDFIC